MFNVFKAYFVQYLLFTLGTNYITSFSFSSVNSCSHLKTGGHFDKSAASYLKYLPERMPLCTLCLLLLNHFQVTPGCYNVTTDNATHIRVVCYDSVFCLFKWEVLDYSSSSILCVTASFPTFFLE